MTVQQHNYGKSPALLILLEGFKLLLHPGLKRYVAGPLVVGFALFGSVFFWAASAVPQLQNQFELWIANNVWEWLASVLMYASWLFWPIFIIIAYFLIAYTLVSVVNIIAAPFNALLSEKVEQVLGYPSADTPEGATAFMASIPRTLLREIRKFISTLKWLVLLFILLFIPFLNILSLLIGAWLMAIQYLDIPADNHQLSFMDFLKTLKTQKIKATAFGLTVMLVSLIPVLNLLLVPAAICASTVLWHRDYHPKAA